MSEAANETEYLAPKLSGAQHQLLIELRHLEASIGAGRRAVIEVHGKAAQAASGLERRKVPLVRTHRRRKYAQFTGPFTGPRTCSLTPSGRAVAKLLPTDEAPLPMTAEELAEQLRALAEAVLFETDQRATNLARASLDDLHRREVVPR